MKTKFAATALILASGLIAAAPSYAGVTAEQVRAELTEASRTGEIVGSGEGLKLNELSPGRYPAKPAYAGASRAQVEAALAQAIRTGDITVGGEIGGKCNELHPSMHPAT